MPTDPLRPPPGATPDIAAILAGYTDPEHRDAIWRAWHTMTEGVGDHAITQAGLLFAAIHHADRAQLAALIQAHEARIASITEGGTANRGGEEPNFAAVFGGDGLRETVRHAVAQEFAARWRRIGIVVAVAFVAGLIFGGWIFHH